MPAKRVLVIDDSASIRREVSETLTSAGFDVIEAEDGIAGAKCIAEDDTICVVLCDIHMPRLNGLDMVARVKSEPRHAALPILMLTAETQPTLIKKAKEAGARGWVVKPFAPSQLVAAVQKLTCTSS